MSLIKQLWLAIGVLMAMAFGVSFVVSTFSAKHYLEEQLYLKNLDNAGSLALSISHMSRDPVTVELQLAAQFDTGHYHSIRLLDPAGSVLVERFSEDEALGAPTWFARLIPIQAESGSASVMDGWKQFGTLFVESQTRFAYAALWEGTLQLLGWFLLAALLSGALGSWMLKRITRPLDDVVAQAEAIGGRRFVTTDEPHTLEFRSVVRAMNSLSARVKAMLADESHRLEALRYEIQHDPLTGVLARSSFMSQAESLLQRDDVTASGVFVLIRIAPLALINKQLGREGTDQLLKDVAGCLLRCADECADWVLGRLNGADFAVMAPGEEDALAVARYVLSAIEGHLAGQPSSLSMHFPTGVDLYTAGEALADVLSRIDGALVLAEQDEGKAPVMANAHARETHLPNLSAWTTVLEQAFASGNLMLARYPVLGPAGQVLHQECPVRMEIEHVWQSAGVIMPWVARLGWQARLDERVVRLAMDALKSEDGDVCINISAESIADPAFRASLIDHLQSSPQLAQRLWIDVPEVGAFRQLEAFRSLCIALQPLGCKIGIEHVGKNFARIGELHDIGLDYLKVDASLVRDIHLNPGNQAFLRGLSMVAHAIGLQAIAEGVMNEGESKALFVLGLDGVTGPGISVPGA